MGLKVDRSLRILSLFFDGGGPSDSAWESGADGTYGIIFGYLLRWEQPPELLLQTLPFSLALLVVYLLDVD